MAGKRQHYVPRLLQRGFLEDPTDPGERTWLHRRDADPKRVGIRHVGVEDWFYSRRPVEGEVTLDDVITALEQDLQKDVYALRTSSPGTIVSNTDAAPLVTHLATRTAYIRSTMTQLLGWFVDEAETQMGSKAGLRKIMGLDAPHAPEVLRRAVKDAMAELPLEQAGMPPALFERLMLFMARERGDEWLEAGSDLLPRLLAELSQASHDKFRDAHNRALATPPDQTGWTDVLLKFSWRIEGADRAILPDCVALVREQADELVPFLLSSGAEAQAIILPLAPDRLLVGRRDGTAPMDLTSFNRDASAASENFFISAARADPALTASIGSRPGQAVREVIDEVFSNLAARSSGDTTTGLIETPASTGRIAYAVNFRDVDSEAAAHDIARVVNVIVSESSRSLPLAALDGMTFAADYADGLRNLDRGTPDLPALEPGALAYGTAVARCVEVRRDGDPKDHIVFAGWIGAGLLADDSDSRLESALIIAKEVAKVGHGARYGNEVATKAAPDEVHRALFPYVSQTPCGFFSSRESAYLAPDHGRFYADLVVDALAHARESILEARLAYRTSDDLDALLRVALPCVSAILGHAADWVGHCDGLAEGETFMGDDLPKRLRDLELEDWLNLFGRDLRALYQDPDRGLDPARLFALARHVERILWTFQICPWPIDAGVYYSVPFGDDLVLLDARDQGTTP